MKKRHAILLAACLLSPAFAGAELPAKSITPATSAGKTMTHPNEPYTDVVDCGNLSQTDLFRRARLWLVQAAADESLALSDASTGDLIGRLKQTVTLPRLEASAGGVYRFRCTVVIECANRKYRATITRIDLHDNGSMQPISPEAYRRKAPEVHAELDKQLKGLLASLQQEVKGYQPF